MSRNVQPARLGRGNLQSRPKLFYATSFPNDETPISENGKWQSNSTSRTRLVTSGGICFGTQTLPNPPYADSYANLTQTCGPDMETIVTIFKGTTSGIQEIEINFRATDTPGLGDAVMYEVNLAHDGQYCNFGGWLGPNADISGFFGLAPDGGTGIQFNVPGGVHNGDLFKATIQGNVMNAYINYNDGGGYHIINTNGPIVDTGGPGGGARYTMGAHGIGTYREASAGASNQFGISHVQFTEL